MDGRENRDGDGNGGRTGSPESARRLVATHVQNERTRANDERLDSRITDINAPFISLGHAGLAIMPCNDSPESFNFE